MSSHISAPHSYYDARRRGGKHSIIPAYTRIGLKNNITTNTYRTSSQEQANMVVPIITHSLIASVSNEDVYDEEKSASYVGHETDAVDVRRRIIHLSQMSIVLYQK